MFLNSFAKQMKWFVSEQHTIECCSSIIPLLWHLSVNNWLLVYIVYNLLSNWNFEKYLNQLYDQKLFKD